MTWTRGSPANAICAARALAPLRVVAAKRVGIGWALGYTIASEIGDIARFPSAKKLVGSTGLRPRVLQSGQTDRRGAPTKTAPATCAGR